MIYKIIKFNIANDNGTKNRGLKNEAKNYARVRNYIGFEAYGKKDRFLLILLDHVN